MSNIPSLTPEVNISKGQLEELESRIRQDGIQKIVVGALIVQDGKYLILRRSADEDFMASFDEIASGHVEPNETILQGLVREVFEETKLRVISISEYVNSFDYTSASGRKSRQLNFLVKTTDSEVVLNSQEHCEYRWVPVRSKEFAELNLSPETRRAILDAHERIK